MWLNKREPQELAGNTTRLESDQKAGEMKFGEEELLRQPQEEDSRHTAGTPTTQQEDLGTVETTSCLISMPDQESKTETSGDEIENIPCEYTKKGFCQVHKRQGERFVVTTTVWKDRGGGRGFGNVYKRKIKYKCRSQNILKIRPMSSSINNEENVS